MLRRVLVFFSSFPPINCHRLRHLREGSLILPLPVCFVYFCTGLSSGTGGLVKNSFHLLRQQMSLTEIMNSIHSDASLFLESTEDTGLQEHTDDNCLYCVCVQILGFQPSNQLSAICSHSGEWLRPSGWIHLNLNLLQSHIGYAPVLSSIPHTAFSRPQP